MSLRGPYETKTHEGGPKTLGDRLRILRIRSGRTQAGIAQDLNTDQAQISAWERDRVRPSKAILGAIAAYFRVDLAVLDSGEGFLEGLSEDPAPPSEPQPAPLGDFPELGPGGLAFTDRATGETRAAESMEALGLLVAAMQAGRRVWVILD